MTKRPTPPVAPPASLHANLVTPNERSACRRAFTVVEAVVAILLLSVGAIALASTSAWSARLTADGRALQQQTQALQYVADSLRTLPCAAMTSASAATPYGPATWSVTRTILVANIALIAPPTPFSRRTTPFAVALTIPCE